MEPMTMIALGTAVAGGVSSIFGGKSQAAAIQAQNQQAMRNWIAQNNQKAINNARSQFESAQAFAQQMRRNEAITKAAWEYEWDAKQAVKDSVTFQQGQLAKQLTAQRGALVNSVLSRGVSRNSSLYNALTAVQSLNALQSARNLEKNANQQLKNITKQKESMMQQMTENVFMPNIAQFDEAPILGDASAAARGGMLAGMLQIGGALGGAAIGSMGGPSSTTTNTGSQGSTFSNPTFNRSNNAYTNRTSGGAVGGR